MRRTKLKVVGDNPTATIKKDIQATLRQLAIHRDKTCVLSKYPETGQCGRTKANGELILQAEHLNSRSNSVSFADMRNIVLLCERHHIFWKPQNSQRYWELIEEIIGKERWNWYLRVKEDRRAYKVDMKLALLALQQDLKKYELPTFSRTPTETSHKISKP